MSAHFSKFGLNTYYGTPYFQAQIPEDYPLSLVLQKCRAFRRLPPNLRRLSALAKRWAMRKYPAGQSDIGEFYDADGYELNPGTGRRLSDAEIDAEWASNPQLAAFKVHDIPIPAGAFPDPDTWEEPPPAPPVPLPDTKHRTVADREWSRRIGADSKWPDPDDRPTVCQLMEEVSSRGEDAVMEEYNLTEDQIPTYEESAAAFREDAQRVLGSPYFVGRPDDHQFLTLALSQSDVYDDLGGRALDLYNRAEAALDKTPAPAEGEP